MSRQAIYVESYDLDRIHSQRLLQKVQKIDTLKALIEMWEQNPNAHDYVIQLRAKLRSAENQFLAMRP